MNPCRRATARSRAGARIDRRRLGMVASEVGFRLGEWWAAQTGAGPARHRRVSEARSLLRRPQGAALRAGSGRGGDAEIESHLDLGSAVFESTD